MGIIKKRHQTYNSKKTMNFKELEKEYNANALKLDMERNLSEREQENYRGRSISVGGSSNGVEVSIRMGNGYTAFHMLNPVETVELINTMAANIGCHVAIEPRNDFSSYRDWSQYIPYDVKHDPNKLLATGSNFTKLEQLEQPEAVEDKQELLFKEEE